MIILYRVLKTISLTNHLVVDTKYNKIENPCFLQLSSKHKFLLTNLAVLKRINFCQVNIDL